VDVKTVQMLDLLQSKKGKLAVPEVHEVEKKPLVCEENITSTCGICGSGSSKGFCSECRLKLCRSCIFGDHVQLQHLVIKLENLDLCPLHKEPCTHFCRDCNRVVCFRCTIISKNCASHSKVTLREFITEHKANTPNDFISAQLDYEVRMLNLKRDYTVENIRSHAEKVVQEIQEKRDELIAEVSENTDIEIAKIQNDQVEKSVILEMGILGAAHMKYFSNVYEVTFESTKFLPNNDAPRVLGWLSEEEHKARVSRLKGGKLYGFMNFELND